MNLSSVIILSSLLVYTACSKISRIELSQQEKNIIEAFNQVYTTQQISAIRVIGSKEFYSMIEEFLNYSEFPIELLTKDSFNISRMRLKTSYRNVLLLNTLQDVFAIFVKKIFQYFRLDGYYILLSMEICNKTTEKKIFDLIWKQQIYNINLICMHNEEILMKTFIPYQTKRCGNTDSIIISRFINNSWSNKNFFPTKFANLYRCQLNVASFLYPPIIMRQTLDNGTYRYYGSEMELLMGLSYALNFTVNHTYYNYFHKGLFFENGTATGILKQVMDKELDMAMGFYFLNFARAKFLSFSQSHYGVSTVIIIPPGSPFTPFEKLFKPFRLSVWICLIATISFGILAILIINTQRRCVKIFVYGHSVKTPVLNIFSILLNGLQNRLPNRTFARYILILFMIFCFIFRTLYQGSLYQFLQADDRNPEMETIDDMLKQKFIFYVRDTLEHSVKHMSFYNR